MLKLYYGNAPADVSIFTFADYGEQQIEQNESIRQGSLALGVQIKRSDIEAELAKSGTPVTRERVDVLMAQELVAKQVPTTQPQVHVQAMLLESERAAQLAKTRLQAGETFDKVANELSKVPVNKINNGDLGWVTTRQADLVLRSTKFGDIVSGTDAGVLSGPVYDDTVIKQFGYLVAKVIDKIYASDNTTPLEARIQGILVGSEQEANDVIDKLNAGADMNELAKQLAQQPSANVNGAELGWITKSQDTVEFDLLFNLPLNMISGPISTNQAQTKGGYWVFNVLEKNDNLALTADQQTLLEKDLLDRCTAELQKDPNYKVENLLTQDMKDFAVNEVVASQGEGSVIIRTNSLPDAVKGVSYSQKLEVYGSSRGNTWSITEGNLPSGLSLDESTGVISGIPMNAGWAGATVEVKNDLHCWTQELDITVRLPVSVSTDSLPDGQVGVDYFATLEVLGTSTTYTWSIITGSLPAGLSMDGPTGVISGTPTTAGTYNFTVQVDDGLTKATQALSIRIQ
jgi:parvulin-like peptidyl-prolyl isomerase